MTADSRTVMADAQFGTSVVMRPPSGFEQLYDGRSAQLPIYLFPQGKLYDPQAQASRPGYDPDLVNGLSVPMGSRLLLWIPNMFWVEDEHAPIIRSYTFIFIWRLRNLYDFRLSRMHWHLPRGRGPNDTTGLPPGEPRVVIPAAYNTVVYNQAEPANPNAPDSLPAVQRGRAEFIKFGTLPRAGPIIPPGFPNLGVVQQGVQDPATAGTQALAPGFLVHELQAAGDQLIVAITRESTVVPNWGLLGGAFPGNADFNLSEKLGAGSGSEWPDLGLYVHAGTAP